MCKLAYYRKVGNTRPAIFRLRRECPAAKAPDPSGSAGKSGNGAQAPAFARSLQKALLGTFSPESSRRTASFLRLPVPCRDSRVARAHDIRARYQFGSRIPRLQLLLALWSTPLPRLTRPSIQSWSRQFLRLLPLCRLDARPARSFLGIQALTFSGRGRRVRSRR